MAELFALNVKDSREFIKSDAALSMVSENRILSARSFLHESDYLLSIGGELLARAVIRNALGLPNESIKFEKSHYGKPYLSGFEGFHFNVSHSENLVICACSEFEIGADCEYVSEKNHIEDLRIVYTPDELKKLDSLDKKDKTLECHNIWTLKESYLKCAGIGLQEEPRTLNITRSGEEYEIFKNEEKLNYFFKTYGDFDKYCVAVCCEVKSLPQKLNMACETYLIA